MPYKDLMPILDVEGTALMFDDLATAIHLYRILYGVLESDHQALSAAFYARNAETAYALIHRIRGALRYCKTPEYATNLLALEEGIRVHDFDPQYWEALHEAYERLYQALALLLERS